MDTLFDFLSRSGFANVTVGNILMIAIGLTFIGLAITKHYEPLLLLPIGFGAIVGNVAVVPGMPLSVYDHGSVLYYLYFGVASGLYPPLIFLGIGAMTDFSTLLSNPKLVLLGAAAQIGIFLTLIGALFLGFSPAEVGAIGIIGGADRPTAIFLSAKLAPHLLGAIAISAYSYMALVPVIQPPIMKLLTTREVRLIRMRAPRKVSAREKILFQTRRGSFSWWDSRKMPTTSCSCMRWGPMLPASSGRQSPRVFVDRAGRVSDPSTTAS